MIRLRVEWHYKCHGCGTEIVSGFFDDSVDSKACPWCGSTIQSEQSTDAGLRSYISRAVKEIEAKANDRIAVGS